MKIFAVLLYLGHFSKCCLHFIFKYTYPEPTGLFGFLPENWDSYYQLTSIGLLFIFVSIEILKKLRFKNISFPDEEAISVQKNLAIKSTLAIVISAAVISLVSYLNFKYGIYIIGIIPKIIFPFPLNSLICWFIYIGTAITVSIFFWNSFWLNQDVKIKSQLFFLVVFEASVYSVSTLSRGMFIYHILPYVIMFSIYASRSLKNKKLLLSRFLIIAAVFICTVFFINKLREHAYHKNFAQEAAKPATPVETKTYTTNDAKKDPNNLATQHPAFTPDSSFSQLGRGLKLFFSLAIDRWVGLEGLMAVSTYPYRSNQLLLDATIKTRQMGQPDFTETITKSVYGKMNEHAFSSLLGILAYIFLTKNLLISFIACLIFMFIIIGTEHLLQKTLNPLTAVLVSFFVLNMVYQINYTGLMAGSKVSVLTFGIIYTGYFINRYREKKKST